MWTREHSAVSIALLALTLLAAAPRAAAQMLGNTPPPTSDVSGHEGPFTAVTAERVRNRITMADYAFLTTDFNDYQNLNVPTRRGMLVHGANEEVWALNTHNSKLKKYVGTNSAPVATYPTVMNPVSVLEWNDDIVVVGSGTRALVLHDRLTGVIKRSVGLPSEPFDCVIDHEHDTAFISCMGEGVVVKVDLPTWTVVTEYDMPGLRASFLYFDDGNELDPNDNEVFVVPELSGNNSIVIGSLQNPFIADGSGPLFPGGGLPDLDVVSINTTSDVITDQATGVGTLLFGIGRNPQTDKLWVLNTESINKNPAMMTEPLLNGVFAENRISIIDTTDLLPTVPEAFISLDVTLTGMPGDPQPGSLPTHVHFEPATGGAWIVCPASDAILAVDQDGGRFLDLELDDGDIPRYFIQDASGTLGLVYCWGTNRIKVISLLAANFNEVLFHYDLGIDPLSPEMKEGRAAFYDADNSLNGRTTCGHCHPEMSADGIGWSIPDSPVDEKGVMVTQSLKSIDDTFPYHWRGERTLDDFNGAFAGLLGGSKLNEDPGELLDKFKAFVFSVGSHANLHQHPSRRIWDANTLAVIDDGLPGMATSGQNLFIDFPADAGTSCHGCHQLPTASNGDIVGDNAGSQINASVHIEIVQLDNILPHKDAPELTIPTVNGSIQRTELGFGTAHNGTIPSLHAFTEIFTAFDDQQHRDVTAFMRQLDTGMSRGAQQSYHVDQFARAATIAAVQDYLLNQAPKGWIDVIAFGEATLAGNVETASWLYNASTELFECENPALGPLDYDTFVALALNAEANMLFVGVPPGNGERLGIDYDNDGLLNGLEAANSADPYDADTDDDGFEDGEEVDAGTAPDDDQDFPVDTAPPLITSLSHDLINSRLIKVHWTSDEKCKSIVTTTTPGGQTYITREERFTKKHTTVIHFDESSTDPFLTITFSAEVELIDMHGNTIVVPFTTWDAGTLLHLNQLFFTQVQDARFVNQVSDASGTLEADVEVVVQFKEGGPPYFLAPGMVVIGQLLVENDLTGFWEISTDFTTTPPLPTSFILDEDGVAPYTALPGPFLVMPVTDDGGFTTVHVSQPGLVAGQEVKFNVIAIEAAPDAYDPANPIFLQNTIFRYQLPTTQPEVRSADTTF